MMMIELIYILAALALFLACSMCAAPFIPPWRRR
jgi:hypothetical protein